MCESPDSSITDEKNDRDRMGGRVRGTEEASGDTEQLIHTHTQTPSIQSVGLEDADLTAALRRHSG